MAVTSKRESETVLSSVALEYADFKMRVMLHKALQGESGT